MYDLNKIRFVCQNPTAECCEALGCFRGFASSSPSLRCWPSWVPGTLAGPVGAVSKRTSQSRGFELVRGKRVVHQSCSQAGWRSLTCSLSRKQRCSGRNGESLVDSGWPLGNVNVGNSHIPLVFLVAPYTALS